MSPTTVDPGITAVVRLRAHAKEMGGPERGESGRLGGADAHQRIKILAGKAGAVAIAVGSLLAGCVRSARLAIPPAYRADFSGSWVLAGEGFGIGKKVPAHDSVSGQHVRSQVNQEGIHDLLQLTEPSPSVLILGDSMVTIEFNGETQRRASARLDDRAVVSELPDGQKLVTRARFDAGRGVLVIERSIKRAGTVRETYSSLPRVRYLQVRVAVEGSPKADLNGTTWNVFYRRPKK